MSAEVTLLLKTYDGESLCDTDRDFAEAFDVNFTPALKNIPQDEHGFCKGKFTVHIKWEPEEE
ncbi:hypothetical protein C121_42 [Stenotrophomonas phage C121]|uniref:hypothetical protein n=1 Tax=Stenotrophomonas phage C121 TaxID=2914029 RepID=UPI002329328B|nr:hypothetical protein PP752_gp42 [Stenotrophomonas phage C121]UKL14775.1 hypothetical protein C121_42 [Stenotrophomonas phage C121]